MLILRQLLLLVTFFSLVSISANGQKQTPTMVVTAFYKYDRSHDTALTRQNVVARQKWLSPSLYRLLIAGANREAAFAKKHPDEKPYFGDGVWFQRPEEYVGENGKRCRQSASVVTETIRANSAVVKVRFLYPKPCDPSMEIYSVKLTKVGGKWLVDDVIAGTNGSLKKDLQGPWN